MQHYVINKGWVAYRISYAMRHNDVGGGGGGLSLMSVREIIEFQGSYIAMNCQWIVFLYTKSAQFVSSYSQYIQVNSSNQVIVQNYVKSADML